MAENKKATGEVAVKEVKDGAVLSVKESPEYKELEAKLVEAESQRDEYKKQAEEASTLVDQQATKLKALESKNLAKTAVAQVSLPKPKLVQVKFLKDHSFYFANKNIIAVVGSTHEVDTNIANKLVSRGIAVVIS